MLVCIYRQERFLLIERKHVRSNYWRTLPDNVHLRMPIRGSHPVCYPANTTKGERTLQAHSPDFSRKSSIASSQATGHYTGSISYDRGVGRAGIVERMALVIQVLLGTVPDTQSSHDIQLLRGCRQSQTGIAPIIPPKGKSECFGTHSFFVPVPMLVGVHGWLIIFTHERKRG